MNNDNDTVLENFSKTNKGGRPRKFSQRDMILMRRVNSDIRTDKTVHNRHYSDAAFRILYDLNCDEYNHLVDKKKEIVKTTILIELGKVVETYSNGEEIMLMLAKTICNKKMKTTRAVDYIKKYRMNQDDSPKLNKHKISGTLRKIVTVINNANIDEDDMQLFFIALKELAEENLPSEPEEELTEE